MNFTTIGSRITTLLRQTPGALGLYTSSELSAAIDDAQLQVCIDTNCLKKFGTVNTVSGTYRYALSATYMCPDLLTIYRVMYNNSEVVRTRVDDPVFYYSSDKASGQPTRYRIWNNNIELDPTPNAAYELRVFYSAQPTLLTLSSGSPDIPLEYQQALIFYACSLLSTKDEKDTRSDRFYLKYNNLINRLRALDRGLESDDVIPLDPTAVSARRHNYQ